MSEMIAIGKIGRHHNQMGEVKCLILSDFPERFLELERVFLEKEDDIKRMQVENVWFNKSLAIVKFVEVSTLKQAQDLKDYYIKIPASEAIDLPEGHYFLHEIIGMDVYTDTDEYLGRLEDIITTGSHDIYVVYVSTPEGKKEVLLPAIHDVVKEIDVEGKKMIVHLLEGLID
ncbi:MAG: 16S rRNA processing protein RimM [Halanaerobiales bacterium]|nr:16S rRNA processing protein RimM [Halanaerobiales bacterium]